MLFLTQNSCDNSQDIIKYLQASGKPRKISCHKRLQNRNVAKILGHKIKGIYSTCDIACSESVACWSCDMQNKIWIFVKAVFECILFGK